MIKVFRFLAMCAISVAFISSIARAQTYKQVDYPGAIFTEISGGPNLEGTSVGVWEDTGGVFHGFSVTAKEVFTSFDPPGSIFTEPDFINLQGVIVGLYLDSSNVSHGFILNGKEYTVVDVKGAAGTALSGINDLGEISGFTCSDPACGNTGIGSFNQSFVRSPDGKYTFFNPPGATSSETSTVSLLGAVVGTYTDNGGNTCSVECQGYLLFLGKYTTINFPSVTFTFSTGGNLQNDIVGTYIAAGVFHAFLLHLGTYTSFDYPEAGVQFTEATGINALGVIVGLFTDSAGATHGFVRTP
jgi:probable HAF family extracellular repeat protein